MNLTIAVTGGIGSGKSTLLKIVEKWGYKSFNADKFYSDLLLNEDFVRQICTILDVAPLVDNGRLILNKQAISDKVFTDNSYLKKLNDFTHPIIMQTMLNKARECNSLTFCEVPLLFEGGFETLFDYVFIVKRNDENRFNDASKRDGKTVEQIKKIAQNQFDYAKIKQNEHTFIIENNSDENAFMENIKVALKNIQK